MPQSYLEYLEAYIANYAKQVPAAKTIGAALGTRRAAQGEPIEPCYAVVAQIAALAAETEPLP